MLCHRITTGIIEFTDCTVVYWAAYAVRRAAVILSSASVFVLTLLMLLKRVYSLLVDDTSIKCEYIGSGARRERKSGGMVRRCPLPTRGSIYCRESQGNRGLGGTGRSFYRFVNFRRATVRPWALLDYTAVQVILDR